MNVLGKYTSYNTIIHRLDPRIKLCSLIIMMVAVFLNYGTQYMNLVIYGVVFLLMIILSIVSRASIITLFKSLKAIWFMVFFLLILNLFMGSQKGDTAFVLFSITVKWATIINVLYIFVRLVLVLMMTNIFSATTKPMEITNALEWLLFPLKLIRIPVHKIAMALSLALRFIPTLYEETQRIMKAQASRGVDYKQGKFKDKIKSLISLIIPLFISAFTTSGELADAMEARGYDPDSRRTKYKTSKWSVKDTVASLCVVLFLGGMITLAIVQFDLFGYLGVVLPALS